MATENELENASAYIYGTDASSAVKSSQFPKTQKLAMPAAHKAISRNRYHLPVWHIKIYLLFLPAS